MAVNVAYISNAHICTIALSQLVSWIKPLSSAPMEQEFGPPLQVSMCVSLMLKSTTRTDGSGLRNHVLRDAATGQIPEASGGPLGQ